MDRAELLDALADLDSRLPLPMEIVIGGGAALILGHSAQRPTADIDVFRARPRLAEIRDLIDQVAEERGLPTAWLNDAMKGWADVLPRDFHDRLFAIGSFNRLSLYSLGRPDLVLLKLFSMRAEDIEDLRTLEPTEEDLRFVEAQLPRIARQHPKQALRIQLYLEQGQADAGG